MSLLMAKDILPESQAKVYTAEMILAIEEVHRLKCIHRDIKPDNILICADGHIKLSDFGMSEGASNISTTLTSGIKGSNLAAGVTDIFKGMGQGLAKAAGSGYITYKILRSFAKKYTENKGEDEAGRVAPRDALTIAQQQFDPYENGKIFSNKSFGGVNKITTTQKRAQGIDFTHDIKLKFQYSLKNLAYSVEQGGALNSKVAMLDIIGNLMGLVMSNAEFYGGANRYKPSNYQFEFSTDIKELMLTATSKEILKKLKIMFQKN